MARYLVAEYLHDWGLRDPEVIAAEARRIVERAEAQTLAVPPDLLEQALCETAIRLTVEEVESAIGTLAASSGPCRLARRPTRGSIVPRMATLLVEFPEAIRHRERPPARLLALLEQSVAPIIPLPNQRDMRPQPRVRVIRIFRIGYWRCILRRLQWKAARLRRA